MVNNIIVILIFTAGIFIQKVVAHWILTGLKKVDNKDENLLILSTSCKLYTLSVFNKWV